MTSTNGSLVITNDLAAGTRTFPANPFHVPELAESIFHHLDVVSLLRCEQTSPAHCKAIRHNKSRIWKHHIIDAFPEGCHPVPRGLESWRGVVLTWWAWRRPWTPDGDRTPVGLPIVEVGEHLKSSDDAQGVVRELTGACAFEETGLLKTEGGFSGGQVVVGDRTWHVECKTLLDCAFDEPAPIVDGNVLYGKYLGATLIGRPPTFEARRATHRFMSVPSGASATTVSTVIDGQKRTNYIIAGNTFIILEAHASSARWSTYDVQFLNLLAPGTDPVRMQRVFDPVFNETLMAHPYVAQPDSFSPSVSIVLTRLRDGTKVAERVISDKGGLGVLHITRYNVFRVHKLWDRWGIGGKGQSRPFVRQCVEVFDMSLARVYSIELPSLFRDVKRVEGDCFLVGNRNPMMEVLKLDLFKKTFRVYTKTATQAAPRDHRLTRSRRAAEEATMVSNEKRSGYLFTTLEHTVDKDGQPTGGIGENRCYWKWLEESGDTISL